MDNDSRQSLITMSWLTSARNTIVARILFQGGKTLPFTLAKIGQGVLSAKDLWGTVSNMHSKICLLVYQ